MKTAGMHIRWKDCQLHVAPFLPSSVPASENRLTAGIPDTFGTGTHRGARMFKRNILPGGEKVLFLAASHPPARNILPHGHVFLGNFDPPLKALS